MRLEFWEEAAKLAPIATALIALAAAVVGVSSIIYQGVVARRRAAIDFFLKTEMDGKSLELYEAYKNYSSNIEAWVSHPDFENSKEYIGVCNYLNVCELIATGVRQNAFSERIVFHFWGDFLPRVHATTKALISRIRQTESEGSAVTYSDLEYLVDKWAREASKR